MAELEWKVFVGDFNSRQICEYNVFDHVRFYEDLQKNARKHRDRERAEFEEQLRRDLMYYYWSKCEWEVVVTQWPPTTSDEKRFYKESVKIDVYDQVRMNWKQFCDYVWANRAELRRREKKGGENDG